MLWSVLVLVRLPDQGDQIAFGRPAGSLLTARTCPGLASADLVDELTNSDYKYRLKVNGVLGLWAGKTVPGPSERDHKGWKEVEERWRGWADREGDKLVTKNKVGGLIAKLDSASPKDAVRVIAQIVAVGRSAIPELESAMQRADYSFYIIEALEQLRGERIGLK